ncbi:MAG TPA: hypothetical protein VNR70_00700 [Steroidobacteraceae bacterium]|jgi:hypothetical protein|nr:hypothetical protein [Steroidobacteraceae bacterium]
MIILPFLRRHYPIVQYCERLARVQAHKIERAASVPSMQGLGCGATLDVFDIGNPVALPSREARVFSLTIEAC